MATSRSVFVYCEELKKGFVTRLTGDQKFDMIYEQVTDLFLLDTELEVQSVALMDARPTIDWIIPPFFRIRDMQFDDAIVVQAFLQPKTNSDRKSAIRATADYVLAKTKKRNAMEKSDGQKISAPKSKEIKKAKISGGTTDQERSRQTSPMQSWARPPDPAVKDSATTADQTDEKSPKRRSSKGSRSKIKITKSADSQERKEKLKQSTLTASQANEADIKAIPPTESIQDERKPTTVKKKKTQRASAPTERNITRPETNTESGKDRDDSSSNTATTSTESSSDVPHSLCFNRVQQTSIGKRLNGGAAIRSRSHLSKGYEPLFSFHGFPVWSRT